MTEATKPLIRKMCAEDLEAVHALECLCFSSPWPLKSFRYELEENSASMQWVTMNDSGEIIGMIVIWLLVDEVHIATLAVHPDHRRDRLATRMVCTALHECVDQGAVSATLEVRTGNSAAQRLYRRMGFQLVGRRPGYYKDTGEDAILMTLHQLDKDHLEIINCFR